MCGRVYHNALVEVNYVELVLSFDLYMGPWAQTQVTRLACKHLY